MCFSWIFKNHCFDLTINLSEVHPQQTSNSFKTCWFSQCTKNMITMRTMIKYSYIHCCRSNVTRSVFQRFKIGLWRSNFILISKLDVVSKYLSHCLILDNIVLFYFWLRITNKFVYSKYLIYQQFRSIFLPLNRIYRVEHLSHKINHAIIY